MKCCGKDRKTRFCPQCGKRLAEHNLGSLVTHCQSRLAQLRKEQLRWENAADKHDEQTDAKRVDRIDRHIESAKRTIVKWEVWVNELEGIIESQTTEADQ